MPLLGAIESPEDLRRLSPKHFPALCQEIRDLIIPTVANVGGHLSSNLGVVELTVALHYVLHTPTDKIVWDTGNQAYTHKLLTGRREQFPTLRQLDGISGFCKREESPYDTFNAGHAGTGISAAVGFVEAQKQLGAQHHVVCVVGDGALTSGMTLEGLQQAGELGKNFTVILNDNQMSISKNVGAIAAYLNRTFTGTFYTKIRNETTQSLSTNPKSVQSMRDMTDRSESLTKGQFLPGLLFEELGFRYVGPIDGHNFDHLLPALQNIMQLNAPTLLHVITQKGLGYEPAQKKSRVVSRMFPF